MKIKKTHLLCAILASSLMVGCASTATTDAAAEQQAAAEAQALEEAQAREEAQAKEAAMAAAEAARAAAEAVANMARVFYFDFDQTTLSADTRAAVDAHIALLRNNSNKVRLEGHADERGTREYNMSLGERRANAIANYMVASGIARYRVETVSYGEERPLSDGSGEMSYSKNRRVELMK